MKLLSNLELEKSSVVANNQMNRERNLRGVNSYQQDMGKDLFPLLEAHYLQTKALRWLDLCCGQGKALIQAAALFQAKNQTESVQLEGIDLVDMFLDFPREWKHSSLQALSLHHWQASAPYDFITCVHGLHYLGDKLGLIQAVINALHPEGQAWLHLDFQNIILENMESASRILLPFFKKAGIYYQSSRKLLTIQQPKNLDLPLIYLGADDQVGPNYTGQAAVNSHYRWVG